jgi:hypothetical protein
LCHWMQEIISAVCVLTNSKHIVACGDTGNWIRGHRQRNK